MAESSNEAELSGGWAIISNEGSDIETLGSEAAAENGAEPVEETHLQDTQDTAPAVCVDERGNDSINETLEEPTLDETLFVPEDRDGAAGKESVTVCSLSDGSDILTLGDTKEDEHVDAEEDEAAGIEDLYLGTSCSSQYAFTSAETVFPAQQATVINSSSSEDEAGQSPNTVLRRRRVRKNTPTSIVTQPEEDTEASESSPREEVEEEVEEEEVKEKEQQQNEEAEVKPAESQDGCLLNKCILFALVVVLSMSFGHFQGVKQIQERQQVMETFRMTELDGVRDLLLRYGRGKHRMNKDGYLDLKNLDELDVVLLLTDVIEKMNQENQESYIKQIHTQAQMNDLEVLLQQNTEEKTNIVAHQQKLAAENHQLKKTLEREKKSLHVLQEELGELRSENKHLGTVGARAESLMSENQKLKEQLEEKEQLIRNSQLQRDGLMAEVQALRTKLDERRNRLLELMSTLSSMRSRAAEAGKEATLEAEELQSRLMELEKRLSFEQQRSDMWERLYVETKEEQAKGDTK